MRKQWGAAIMFVAVPLLRRDVPAPVSRPIKQSRNGCGLTHLQHMGGTTDGSFRSPWIFRRINPRFSFRRYDEVSTLQQENEVRQAGIGTGLTPLG